MLCGCQRSEARAGSGWEGLAGHERRHPAGEALEGDERGKPVQPCADATGHRLLVDALLELEQDQVTQRRHVTPIKEQ